MNSRVASKACWYWSVMGATLPSDIDIAMLFVRSTLLLLFVLLVGCMPVEQAARQHVAQDIAAIAIPKTWLFAPVNTRHALKQEWWRAYGSHELNTLIDEALAHNQNLLAAALTWRKARLAVTQQQAEALPQLNASLHTSVSQQSDRTAQYNSGSQFSAGYQLDLWHKLSLNEDNARWLATATYEDALAVRLSLVGDIVRTYFRLAWIETQQRFAQQQLEYIRQNLTRMRGRLVLGAVTPLDVARSHQTLLQQQLVIEALHQRHATALLQLALLIGRPPQLLHLHPPALMALRLPNINTPLPAVLLAQRPDLRAAQYRLQQQLNDITLAEQAFYPDINLNAGLTGGGIRLTELISNPIGSLGATLTLPFLQMKQLTLRKKQNELTYQQALLSFEQKLYQALQDVNSALLSRQSASEREQYIQRNLEQAKTITKLTRVRYQFGAESLQTVLDAEQAQREAIQTFLENRYRQLLASVDLALALGGGAVVSNL